MEPIASAVRYARCCARFAFSSRIEARRNAPRQNAVEARRTAQGRASVTERGVGDGGQILTTLVALAVAAIRCRLKQITEGIALQPLSFYYSLIPIICSPMTAKKIFDVTDVEVLSTGIYTRRASNKISPTLYSRSTSTPRRRYRAATHRFQRNRGIRCWCESFACSTRTYAPRT